MPLKMSFWINLKYVGRDSYFSIKFRVDENNILTVTAGSTNHIVQRDRKQFTDKEIRAFIQEENEMPSACFKFTIEQQPCRRLTVLAGADFLGCPL